MGASRTRRDPIPNASASIEETIELSIKGGCRMNDEIKLLDVVALTTNLPKHSLLRGEIGTVIECYSDNAFEIEFVAQDGYTYALVTLRGDQIIPLRQKRDHSDTVLVQAAL
jgi:hypothetical protein